MNKKDAARIIRQRISPSLFDFCYVTTKEHLNKFFIFRNLLRQECRPLKILDLGCGYKPFKKILAGIEIEQYLGVDFDRNRSAADIEAAADNLPLKNDSFDAIIASEVLEHVPRLKETATEIRRVAKNGALIYISTPFLFGEHGVPYDFQRITSYFYRELFKNDDILLLEGTNVSLATPFFVGNVVFENIAVLKKIPLLPQIYFFVNNILALSGKAAVDVIEILLRLVFWRDRQKAAELASTYFKTMPGGYDIIVRIKK